MALPRPRSADGSQIDIGPLEAGEEDAALDCLGACFRFAPDPGRWRHLYRDGPAGDAVIVVVRSGGALVSGVALLPRRIRFFGRWGLAGHVLDSMTRPEWRGIGIRSAATTLARRIARERGLLAVFSFANDSSLPGSLRQPTRRRVSEMPLLIRPFWPSRGTLASALVHGARQWSGSSGPSEPESAVAGPLPAGADLVARAFPEDGGWSAPAFDDRHTRLFERAEGVAPIAMIRDADHLTWRYAAAPGMPYRQRDVCDGAEVVASAVLRTAEIFGGRVALLMEWLWQRGARAAAADLVRDAVRSARAAGLDAVAALAMPGTAHRRSLLHLGFLPIPAWLAPKRVTFNVGPENEGDDSARWYEPSHWHLSWGDGFLL